MKSIFLKLSLFWFGAARRHCPFRSIIHKPISLFFAIIFFSIHCFLVPVAAAQIQPQFNPIIGSSAYQVQNFVSGLSPDQLQIFYLLSGTQAITYTGFGNYAISNELTTVDKVTSWLKEFGEHFYTDLFFGSIGLPSDLAAPLYDSLLGSAEYSSGISSSFSDWVDSVTSSQDSVLVPFHKDLVPSYNQFFAVNGGLYNWSISESEWISDFDFKSGFMDSNVELEYFNYLMNYSEPYIRANRIGYNWSNVRFVNNLFYKYHNLFINSYNHTIKVVDDSGIAFDITSLTYIYVFNGFKDFTTNGSNYPSFIGLSSGSYDPNQYTNYQDIARDFFNNQLSTQSDWEFAYSDYIDKVYYGISWDSKTLLQNIDDLNLIENPDPYVLQPLENLLVDIKGLIQDLVDANSVKQPVFDNLYDLNGQPEPDPATQPISVSVQLPDSGIIVPSGLFGSSKGFIDYLWYMTKPLVQYTHDFLGTMWFDGVDGFDFSGPAPIVFGVITLGLIGGLIVKFLL